MTVCILVFTPVLIKSGLVSSLLQILDKPKSSKKCPKSKCPKWNKLISNASICTLVWLTFKGYHLNVCKVLIIDSLLFFFYVSLLAYSCKPPGRKLPLVSWLSDSIVVYTGHKFLWVCFRKDIQYKNLLIQTCRTIHCE